MKEPERIIRLVDLGSVKIGKRDDDIIHVYFLENTEITVSLQKEIEQVISELVGNNLHPFIYEAEPFVNLTPEAKRYSIENENNLSQTARVFFVQNLAQRIQANFYNKFLQSGNYLKIVDDFNQGIRWLLENHSSRSR